MNFLFEKKNSEKPIILFLHGWGGSIDSFLGVAKTYNDRSVLIIDFAGHGKSLEPETPWGVPDFANSVFTLLKQLCIEQVEIVSHSFGGRVAIWLASHHPNLVKKLVLCDSAGIVPFPNIKRKIAVFKYKLCKILSKLHLFSKKRLLNFGSSDYRKLSDIMKSSFVKIVNLDLKKYAKYIQCETLIVWGENDYDTPVWMAKKLNKIIPNSDLIIFNNCGHFAYLEEYQKFILILHAFVI